MFNQARKIITISFFYTEIIIIKYQSDIILLFI